MNLDEGTFNSVVESTDKILDCKQLYFFPQVMQSDSKIMQIRIASPLPIAVARYRTSEKKQAVCNLRFQPHCRQENVVS